MGITLPNSALEVVNRILAEVKNELPSSNPYLVDSLIRAVPVGLGNRVYDYYYTLKQAVEQSFPDTAIGDYLQFWADLKNMAPGSATPASGPVTFTGNNGDTVPTGSVFTIGSLEYEVDSDVLIGTISKTVSNLTASGTTAVCITDDEHQLGSGMSIELLGVNESGWNGTWDNIEVLDANRFQFEVPLGLISPATGTIEITYDGGSGDVTCTENGTGTNQSVGTTLESQSSITGIDDTAYVQYDGLTGGYDDETDDEYRERIKDRWRNPQTPFNPARIESVIREISGNTRVWVHRVTPVVGAVTAYFVRDNDESIIPSATEVQEALDAVLAITPANTYEGDVYIEAPTGVSIDVELSQLIPDSLSMRQAVEDQISSFYRGGIREGEDHEVEKLRSAIYQTYDVTQGERLQSFVLDEPSTDEPINQGEIAVEGTVTVNN